MRGRSIGTQMGWVALTISAGFAVHCAPAPTPPASPVASSPPPANQPPVATPQPAASAPPALNNLMAPAARHTATAQGPTALVGRGKSVDWWFAFKFNTATFSGCNADKTCPFGGTPQSYRSGEGEEFAVASSASPTLALNASCIGEDASDDPVGATFEQAYKGDAFYVLWNDQFYDDPKIQGCSKSCSAPWGHSKGMLAWSQDGDGVVMQVTTPSWPAAGNQAHPRTDGNTLGCVTDDNVLVSQHFFALTLSHEDVVKVLAALANASVVTDTSNQQIVHSGGPSDVQDAVSRLGQKSTSTAAGKDALSKGVTLISKPSALQVPPWQMVSAVLGGVPLRAATWWESANKLPSTTSTTPLSCWDSSLGKPGAVQIATTGTWESKDLGLNGGSCKNCNHAKVGVATGDSDLVIFGDMNQEGSLSGNCGVSQNGRGGLFFVISDPKLHASVSTLLKGDSAPESRTRVARN